MDQLRQKVNERRSRHSQFDISGCGADPDAESPYAGGGASDTGYSQYKNNINDEDIYVYGDEWSSDDDDG
ncbi:unnamed protein product [Cylicostephanus goldi]|uniref:Uncharacterized protein n=1 Tax=Cylicostephanus goldi TaxID=71465 RepID=A0A3P7PJQ4_CYLGO|nr:unnamed protein product [Cylicostephanus goldi]